MKNLINRFSRLTSVSTLVAIALFGAAQSACAQASASANGTATIVPAITITKSTDLQFGLIVAGAGGTVVIATDSARTANGPAALSNASYPVSAASFTVTGGSNLVYSISLPTSASLSGPSSATMTINNFVSNPANTGTIGSGGNATLNVGATLTVSASQSAGAYTGSFSVTVNYQ